LLGQPPRSILNCGDARRLPRSALAADARFVRPPARHGAMKAPSLVALAVATLACAAACAVERNASQEAITWQVAGVSYVQSWAGESLPARSIEVAVGSRRDTIVGVLDPPLIFLGDTLLLGVRGDSVSDRRELFAFGSRRAKLRTYPFPSEVVYNFHDVAIAPDGHHWLYLAYDSTAHSDYLAVRVWPDGEVVMKSDSIPQCECDVDRHHAHWVTADSFELATLVSSTEWERVAGSVTRRRFGVDTIVGAPEWH
jgi:hypothetical protein